MRDVSVIKQKRDELKEELKFVNEKRKSLGRWTDMCDYDKKIFAHLTDSVKTITTQINALEYILNEDTELNDWYPRYARISKEDIFGTKESIIPHKDSEMLVKLAKEIVKTLNYPDIDIDINVSCDSNPKKMIENIRKTMDEIKLPPPKNCYPTLFQDKRPQGEVRREW